LVLAICRTPEELRPLAEALARVVEPGDTLLLHGELGAGKTTLTQMLAMALGVSEDQYVSSPSFTLLHEYMGNIPMYHMDLYRLRDEEDVEAAGLLDVLEQNGVCIIEWPDRLGALTPDLRLDIRIEQEPDASRRLVLTPHGPSWEARMARIADDLAHSKK
jgi:tRNA threonylcarbamoyladenosine biosynthesis protein TsaE